MPKIKVRRISSGFDHIMTCVSFFCVDIWTFDASVSIVWLLFHIVHFFFPTGIQTSQDARFYALSAKFDKFSNEGKDLVIQFQVKHEQNIDCGGGYVKVFPSTMDQKDMHGDSPYNIMFGPDICGPGTKKVHVIFNYKGKNLLIKKDIRCKVSTDASTVTSLSLKCVKNY